MGIEGTLAEVIGLVGRFAPGYLPELHPSGVGPRPEFHPSGVGPLPEFHPSGVGHEGISADRLLVGAGGLGFDSVRLVELLLACEDRFGVSLEVDRLAADHALSAAGIAAAIAAARGEVGRA